MKTQCFDISGMSCAACSARVDKTVSSLNGINTVNVNLLKNNMTVEYDESVLGSDDIIRAVEKSGYGASLPAKADSLKKGIVNTASDDAKKLLSNDLLDSIIKSIPQEWVEHEGRENVGLLLEQVCLRRDNMRAICEQIVLERNR